MSAIAALRRLKRSFGISAGRVAVRPDLPWYWQVAAVVSFVLAVAWAVSAVFGKDVTRAQMDEEVTRLKRNVERDALPDPEH